MVKLCTFDLDQVLVDMSEGHRLSLNKALWDIEKYTIDEIVHKNHMEGLPTRIKLDFLLKHGVIQAKSIELIKKKKQEYTIDYIEKNIKFDHEKFTLLTKLKESGFQLACVTNSIKFTCNLMLKKSGLYELFDIIISNEDIKFAKPSPEGYIEAMYELNKFPSQCLIVENPGPGLEAAKASGVQKILVVNNPSEVSYENIMKVINEV